MSRIKGVIWNRDRTTDDVFSLLTSMHTKYDWQYHHAGQEHCPSTGEAHVDMYYENFNARKLNTEINKFNRYFGKGDFNLRFANGTAGENMDYSSKEEGDFQKEGEPGPGQGARTDLAQVTAEILSGKVTCDDVLVSNPNMYHSYGRTLSKAEDLYLRKQYRTEMTKGIWYYGPTAVGKSHKAFDGFTPHTHYVFKNDNGWQDGYTGQGTIIINDFRGSIKYNELLQLVDKWPYNFNRRAREPVPVLAHTVIITSSVSPHEIYAQQLLKSDSLEQLERRFEIVHMPVVRV